MAEVSRRVGARAVRISLLSSYRSNHTIGEHDGYITAVSSLSDEAVWDHPTQLSNTHDQTKHQLYRERHRSVLTNGSLPCVFDSRNDKLTAETLEASGSCLEPLGYGNENPEECPSPPQQIWHSRDPSFRPAPHTFGDLRVNLTPRRLTFDPHGASSPQQKASSSNGMSSVGPVNVRWYGWRRETHRVRLPSLVVDPLRPRSLCPPSTSVCVRGFSCLRRDERKTRDEPHAALLNVTALNPLVSVVCVRPCLTVSVRQLSWRCEDGKRDDQPPPPLLRSRTAYYDILRVSPNATAAQIKSAYYRQAMALHPDRHGGSQESKRGFAEVSEAYAVLKDKRLRKKYDSGLLTPADLGQAPGHTQQPHSRTYTGPQQRTYTRTGGGGKIQFDFEAFYRAHYGGEEEVRREMLRRRREEALRRAAYEELLQFRKRKKIIEISMLVLVAMAGAILISIAE